MFGPRPRSYVQKVNKKARRAALSGVLSQRLAEGRLVVLNTMELDAPKTKEFLARLDRLADAGTARPVAAGDLDRAEESFRIAEARYREGVGDYQTVLISQNQLFNSRNAFLNNKLAQLNAMVAFYQSLGGGWQSEYWQQ